MAYEYLLDEYSTETLEKEIERRKIANSKGLCDYCGRLKSKGNPCRFPERHR